MPSTSMIYKCHWVLFKSIQHVGIKILFIKSFEFFNNSFYRQLDMTWRMTSTWRSTCMMLCTYRVMMNSGTLCMWISLESHPHPSKNDHVRTNCNFFFLAHQWSIPKTAILKHPCMHVLDDLIFKLIEDSGGPGCRSWLDSQLFLTMQACHYSKR